MMTTENVLGNHEGRFGRAVVRGQHVCESPGYVAVIDVETWPS